MSKSLFDKVVVPVANREDAAATTAALSTHLSSIDGHVIAVYVIEKAGGAPDKASVEQREQVAEDIFATVVEGLDDTERTVETEIRYGTDVAATIIKAAQDRNASSIVFTPRGGGRLVKLLTGDVTHTLVHDSDVPVIALPNRELGDT